MNIRRSDDVAKFVHWKPCQKFHKWYEQGPEGSVENESVKLL